MGPHVGNVEVEVVVMEYYTRLRAEVIAVSTNMLVLKSLTRDSTFHDECLTKLGLSVYDPQWFVYSSTNSC